jgi:chromosome segregation ATPase
MMGWLSCRRGAVSDRLGDVEGSVSDKWAGPVSNKRGDLGAGSDNRDDGAGAVSDKRGDAGRAGRRHRGSRDGLPRAAGRPVPAMAPDELGVLLVAHCRQATTELPPGKPGVRWAADFLAALPTACCRRLPDIFATGPKVFEFLVGQGFFAAMPSPRLVPLVLGLVAGVSPLLQARSSRQWGLWLARVWDPGSPILATIRKRTPAYLIGIQAPAPSGPRLRSAQIRDERDRLAADLANAATVNGQLRAVLTQMVDEGNRLAADLNAATEQEQQAVAAVAAERDRLAGELAAATERAQQMSRNAETDGVRLKQTQELSDRLTAELAGLRVEHERMSGALAMAEETAKQWVSEHELMSRLLADEKFASEQLRGKLTALRRDFEAARGASGTERPAIRPLDSVYLAVKGIQASRERRAQRNAAAAAGLHPDHDLLAEAESARRQADAVADALRVENSELRAELDVLRARCGDRESGPVQVASGALADAEHRLTQAHAELAAVRQDADRLTGLLDRKREIVRDLQEMKETQEVELAAANAELAQWKTGASGLLSVALARELAMQATREAQARRPPVDAED